MSKQKTKVVAPKSANNKKVVAPKHESNHTVYIGKVYGECPCINDARGFVRGSIKRTLELPNNEKFSNVSVPTEQKKSAIKRQVRPQLVEYLTNRMTDEVYYIQNLQKHMANTLQKSERVIANDKVLNDSDFFTKTEKGYSINKMTDANRDKLITIATQQGIDYITRNLKVIK